MTIKQVILKGLYPLIMRLSKGTSSKGKVLQNSQAVKPKVPFYNLKATRNNGQVLNFENFRNKKVLLVNTASNCGYTGQYEELQKLHEQYSDNLVILGFPANDFKEQEKSNDAEIAEFCQVNFGVTFPLAKKSIVIKGAGQSPVYNWLTNAEQNGWNAHQPDWNFSKYLINENGILTHYFGSAVSPLSPEMLQAIKD